MENLSQDVEELYTIVIVAPVLAVAISHDGDTVIAACGDNYCHVMCRDKLNKGRLLRYRRRLHLWQIKDVAIAGNTLASAARDGHVCVYGVQESSVRRFRSGWTLTSEAQSCSLSANGKYLAATFASVAKSRKVRVFSTNNEFTPMEWSPSQEVPGARLVRAVIGSVPNYLYVAIFLPGTAANSSHFMIKRLTIGDWVCNGQRVIKAEHDDLRKPGLAADSEMDSCVIATSSDLVVWRPDEGSLSMNGYSKPVTIPSCSMSSDGSIVVASMGRRFGVWDATSGMLFRYVEGHTMFVTSCAISANGRKIATASLDGTVRIWQLRNLSAQNETPSESEASEVPAQPPYISNADIREGNTNWEPFIPTERTNPRTSLLDPFAVACKQHFAIAVEEGERSERTLTLAETRIALNALLEEKGRTKVTRDKVEEVFCSVVVGRKLRVSEVEFTEVFQKIRKEQDTLTSRQNLLEQCRKRFIADAAPDDFLSIRFAGFLICSLRDELQERNLLTGRMPTDDEVDREIENFDENRNDQIEEDEFIQAAKNLLFKSWGDLGEPASH